MKLLGGGKLVFKNELENAFDMVRVINRLNFATCSLELKKSIAYMKV